MQQLPREETCIAFIEAMWLEWNSATSFEPGSDIYRQSSVGMSIYPLETMYFATM